MNGEVLEALEPLEGAIIAGTLAVAVLAAVLVWQIFRTFQVWLANRGDAARLKDYRSLAQRAVVAEEKLAEAQERIARDLAEMRTSVGDVERLLSEVE